MGLRTFVAETLGRREEEARSVSPLSFQQWVDYFNYQGLIYPFVPQLTISSKQEGPSPTFDGYTQMAYKSNAVIFACMQARLALFSEARFQWRQLRSGRPGDLFGNQELAILERPWPNGTTGDLLARAIQDADIAGNFYAVRRGQYLRRMRPDWVTIVVGSQAESANEVLDDLDAQVLGYIYQPRGVQSDQAVALQPEEVCHFAPIPDPSSRFRGTSWLISILRELMADSAMTEHRLKYFEQGATVNLAIEMDPGWSKEQRDTFVEMFKAGQQGLANAYRTLFLVGGTSAKPIGSDMQQLDFKVVQGGGETRIAAAAGVPPIVAGLSEGLQGSSLNAGNYAAAMRRFADITMRYLWRNFAGSVSTLLTAPPGAELWYDDRDIPALRDDVQAAATALSTKMTAIRTAVDGGFDPNAAVDAIEAGDLRRLKHTGAVSVQLYPNGQQASPNGPPQPQVPQGA